MVVLLNQLLQALKYLIYPKSQICLLKIILSAQLITT